MLERLQEVVALLGEDDTLPGSSYEALGFTEAHDMSAGVRAFVRFGA